jgi:hypothetical protein
MLAWPGSNTQVESTIITATGIPGSGDCLLSFQGSCCALVTRRRSEPLGCMHCSYSAVTFFFVGTVDVSGEYRIALFPIWHPRWLHERVSAARIV